MQCVELKWPGSWSVGTIEIAGADEQGLGGQWRGRETPGPARRPISFCVRADIQASIACKQAPGEDAKKKMARKASR